MLIYLCILTLFYMALQSMYPCSDYGLEAICLMLQSSDKPDEHPPEYSCSSPIGNHFIDPECNERFV